MLNKSPLPIKFYVSSLNAMLDALLDTNRIPPKSPTKRTRVAAQTFLVLLRISQLSSQRDHPELRAHLISPKAF